MIDVGDILCTRNTKSRWAYFIRLGAAILNRPNTVNHVIIVHHRDPEGVLWGIEGRPGGVGDVAITRRMLHAPYHINNMAQPKTLEQRYLIAKAAERFRRAPYDWTGIALDAGEALGVSLWDTQWGAEPPAHVVCSSFADWVYESVGLASPAKDRTVTPGDWAAFILERGWE